MHFGSLVAAVGSYLQARKCGGTWRVRIEDIDPPREVHGSAHDILETLARLGMHPDGSVLYQSTRISAYRTAWQKLLDQGRAFWCGCSRADLNPDSSYPGTCRQGIPAGREPRCIRLKVTDQPINFTDLIQGALSFDLAGQGGDFVIRRADGLPAYQLAVAADDAWQGITEVIRGADLLDSTARQIYLQEQLGLQQPVYGHLPVVTSPDGRKLSKRLGSDPVGRQAPVESIRMALEFLGHEPPLFSSLSDLWSWALRHWSLDRIPRVPSIQWAPRD